MQLTAACWADSRPSLVEGGAVVGVDPAFVCGGGTAEVGSSELGSIYRAGGMRKRDKDTHVT